MAREGRFAFSSAARAGESSRFFSPAGWSRESAAPYSCDMTTGLSSLLSQFPESPAPASLVTGTGAFSAHRLDAAANYQPAFVLGWQNLRAENGRFGIFKTPLHKTIRIDGLQMKFYQHVPEGDGGTASAASVARRPQDFNRTHRKIPM